MAVAVELRVAEGSREQHDAADLKVAEAIQALGGPPPELMVHLTWPDGAGFVMLDVWRTEADARAFLESIVHPAFAKLGLRANEPIFRPVWGMANP